MSEFDKHLLNVLACPHCKGKLKLYQHVNQQGETVSELVCRFDRLAYPINNGTPTLLHDSARLLLSDELDQVPR